MSVITQILIMDQVFYRQPLKTNVIHFNCTSNVANKTAHNSFSGTRPGSVEGSRFSVGNSPVKEVSHNTIPLYYPECDQIPIDFD